MAMRSGSPRGFAGGIFGPSRDSGIFDRQDIEQGPVYIPRAEVREGPGIRNAPLIRKVADPSMILRERVPVKVDYPFQQLAIFDGELG